MEDYIIPYKFKSVEDFSKLGKAVSLYDEFETTELRINLHNVAMEVGCKMKNETFWCQHNTCLESIVSFNKSIPFFILCTVIIDKVWRPSSIDSFSIFLRKGIK